MKRKGKVSNLMAGLLVFIVAVVSVAGVFAYTQYEGAVTQQVVEFEADGEWDTLQAPQEVAGTDLTITKTSITEDADLTAGSGVLVTSYDLNGTDGNSHYLAFGLEVSSNGLSDATIEGALDDLTTSQVVISDAYIVPDEEGKNLDVSDSVYEADVPTEQDEFEFDIGKLGDGEYVVVPVVKAISTSGIASGNDIVEVEFDADTDDDVDAFTADIQNVAAS